MPTTLQTTYYQHNKTHNLPPIANIHLLYYFKKIVAFILI